MNQLAFLRALSLLAALACLTLGSILAGATLVLLAVPAMIVFWIVVRRQAPFPAASALLATYLALAAMGIALHASALLMALGSVFALVCWDLSDPSGTATAPMQQAQVQPLERRRQESLAMMCAISVALIAVASGLRLQLPFGVVALLALLSLGCILYSVYMLRRSRSQRD